MSQTGQIMQTWTSCKLCPHALESDYSESKDGSGWRQFYIALHRTVGKTESFTMPRQWRHTAIFQSCSPKFNWSLSIIFLPVTLLMWDNVPGPLLLNHTASDWKLGEGLGMRLSLSDYGHIYTQPPSDRLCGSKSNRTRGKGRCYHQHDNTRMKPSLNV